MQMRLRMLKHGVGKGRHETATYVCLRMQCTTVATERAGYVLYRALVGYAKIKAVVVSIIDTIDYMISIVL